MTIRKIKQSKISHSIRRLKIVVIAFLVLSMSSYNLHAQAKNERGIIYTKDGSILKGFIKKETADTVYLLVLGDLLIAVPRSRIKKLIDSKKFIFHKNGQFHYRKGLFWAAAAGAGVSTFDGGGGGITGMFGFRLNERISIAAGIGIEGFSRTVGGFFVDTEFISPYLYGRYYPSIPWRIRPFAYGRIGYGLANTIENDFQQSDDNGGFQGQAGIGFHFASTKAIRFVVSLGYHMQKADGIETTFDFFGNEATVDYNLLIHQPIFSVSMEFR